MWAYYNEIDPFCAQWTRNLMAAGLIMEGEVDERDIREVDPGDLVGFERCHFFSGICGWELALEIAGWEGPVWTGSCPCQPFSTAGRQRGADDERHLWPAFQRLIAECQPSVVFGEQTSGKLGRAWLASVRFDLEELGFTVGGADLCAAGIGAPHIRQRLWWVADSPGARREGGENAGAGGRDAEKGPRGFQSERGREAGGMGNASCDEQRRARIDKPGGERKESIGGSGTGVVGMGHPVGEGLEGQSGDGGRGGEPGRDEAEADGPVAEAGAHGPVADAEGGAARHPGFAWEAAETIECADGKVRLVEPGTFPLAHGVPGKVGKLRAYGNAIAPPLPPYLSNRTWRP